MGFWELLGAEEGSLDLIGTSGVLKVEVMLGTATNPDFGSLTNLSI
jgi:hypothetical protein